MNSCQKERGSMEEYKAQFSEAIMENNKKCQLELKKKKSEYSSQMIKSKAEKLKIEQEMQKKAADLKYIESTLLILAREEQESTLERGKLVKKQEEIQKTSELLAAKIVEKTKEKENLAKSLESIKTELEKLMDEKKKKSEDFRLAKEQADKISNSFVLTLEKIKESTEKIGNLDKEAEKLTQKLKEKEQDRELKLQKSKETEKVKFELEKEIEDLSKEIAKKEEEIKKSDHEKKKDQELCTLYEKKIESHRGKLALKCQEFDENKRVLSNSLKTKENELQTLAFIEKEKKNSEESIKEQEHIFKEKKEQISSIMKETSAISCRQREVEKTILFSQKKLETFINELQSQKGVSAELKSGFSDLLSQETNSQNLLEILEIKLIELSNNAQINENELTENESELELNKAEFDKRREEIKHCEEMIKTLKREIEELERKKIQTIVKIAALVLLLALMIALSFIDLDCAIGAVFVAQQLIAAGIELHEISKNISLKSKDLDTQENQNLPFQNSQMLKADTNWKNCEDVKKSLKEKKLELERELMENEQQKQNQKSNLEVLKEKKDQNNEDQQQSEKKENDLKAQVDQGSDEIAKSKIDLNNVKADLVKSRNESALIEKEFNECKESLSELKTSLNKFIADVYATTERINSLNNEINDLECRIDGINNEMGQCESEIKSLESLLQGAKRELDMVKEDIKKDESVKQDAFVKKNEKVENALMKEQEVQKLTKEIQDIKNKMGEIEIFKRQNQTNLLLNRKELKEAENNKTSFEALQVKIENELITLSKHREILVVQSREKKNKELESDNKLGLFKTEFSENENDKLKFAEESEILRVELDKKAKELGNLKESKKELFESMKPIKVQLLEKGLELEKVEERFRFYEKNVDEFNFVDGNSLWNNIEKENLNNNFLEKKEKIQNMNEVRN